MKTQDARRALFAACKALNMSEEDRHTLIFGITGVRSSKDFTPGQWKAVLDHLNKLTGHQSKTEWAWVDRAEESKRPLLRRLIVLAGEARIVSGRQVAYIEGILRQSSGLNAAGTGNVLKPLSLCDMAELSKVHAIMAVHVRKLSAARAEAEAELA
jgi:hypothetical protein